MAGFSLLIDRLAVGQDGPVTPLVTFFRGYELDTAVTVLVVIPLDELLHPGARLQQTRKSSLWVGGPVLTGAE
jgi:hypothetical protein